MKFRQPPEDLWNELENTSINRIEKIENIRLADSVVSHGIESQILNESLSDLPWGLNKDKKEKRFTRPQGLRSEVKNEIKGLNFLSYFSFIFRII